LPRLERPVQAVFAVGSRPYPARAVGIWEHGYSHAGGRLAAGIRHHALELVPLGVGRIIHVFAEMQDDIRVATFGGNAAKGALAVGGKADRSFANVRERKASVTIRARVGTGLV